MNPLHNELQIEGQFEALNTNVTTKLTAAAMPLFPLCMKPDWYDTSMEQLYASYVNND